MERRSDGLVGSVSLLPLVGVPVLSFEVGICDDCGLGEAGFETGCVCWRDSCAVRSARAVSIIAVLVTCDTWYTKQGYVQASIYGL